MDQEMWKMVNGKLITIPKISDLCEALETKFNDQEEEINKLREENRKLKNDIWEKEEIGRLKKENQELHESCLRGFPISLEEKEKIDTWRKQHELEKDKKHLHYYHYVFSPTHIGLSGKIVCSCGKEFEFCEI